MPWFVWVWKHHHTIHHHERTNSDVDEGKIVPCYGEVWKQKRNRLRESSPFKDAIGKESRGFARR